VGSTVTLNPDQEEIRAVARRFLESRYPSERVRALMGTPTGFERADWDELVELGWPGIALPEAVGGTGYGMAERCLLVEEMGRALAAGPYLGSAVLAADALSAVRTPAAEELLAAITAGEQLATLVAAGDLAAGPDVAGEVHASAAGERILLNGRGGQTLDAHLADVLLVAAHVGGGEVGLFAVRQGDGTRFGEVMTVDETRRFSQVEFADAPAVRLDGGGDARTAIDDGLRHSAITLAAEMVGGAQRCLEMTVEYMKERQQFGVAIGSFQALKHRLADLAVAVDAAREGVYFAADAVDDGGGREGVVAAAAVAKAGASDAYVYATEETVQLHGGIGFTWEHDAHLFYKRALVSSRLLGLATDHRDRLAIALGV
jgi:alkylation response protein AidB-like acyl-CoA dehydrogenase